jgi:hypothetical protein
MKNHQFQHDNVARLIRQVIGDANDLGCCWPFYNEQSSSGRIRPAAKLVKRNRSSMVRLPTFSFTFYCTCRNNKNEQTFFRTEAIDPLFFLNQLKEELLNNIWGSCGEMISIASFDFRL